MPLYKWAMFTGIIEVRCRVEKAAPSGGGLLLAVDSSALEGPLQLGESVAVNGVCLTISSLDGALATFDAVEETIERSNLRELRTGDYVNAERALKVGDRLGGHFVAGHVDGIGVLKRIKKLASSTVLTVECGPELAANMIEKGSVALEGVSLTLVSVDKKRFSVATIPHTLAVTTLGEKRSGAHLNIEVDMLGKWVRKLLGGARPGSKISRDFLAEHGFQ